MEDTLRALKTSTRQPSLAVLILVLMEDTLREDPKNLIRLRIRMVLILVLMEDTLRAYVSCWYCSSCCIVLILVLMEDTLRE